MNESFPLISCLCITNRRVPLLKTAISCFLAQSYPNKELIIVCQSNDLDTIRYIGSLERSEIRLVSIFPPDRFTLGELRNISIENSKGEYFCQWDDDDWNHRDRLMSQYTNLVRSFSSATMLMNVLMYDINRTQAYFSNFRLWDQTLFAKRELLEKFKYQSLEKSEDKTYTDLLLMESRIYPTVAPNLYIYLYHGKNTWGSDHFDWLFGYAQPLSGPASVLIRDILNNQYSVDEASDLLNADVLLKELNYFHHRGVLIRQEAEAASIQTAAETIQTHTDPIQPVTGSIPHTSGS